MDIVPVPLKRLIGPFLALVSISTPADPARIVVDAAFIAEPIFTILTPVPAVLLPMETVLVLPFVIVPKIAKSPKVVFEPMVAPPVPQSIEIPSEPAPLPITIFPLEAELSSRVVEPSISISLPSRINEDTFSYLCRSAASYIYIAGTGCGNSARCCN